MGLKTIFHSYSAAERRSIAIYIVGIMFYKLGLEFFNGSITTLATDRFKSAQTFTKLGAAQGVNQAAQCVGAILIAPLIAKFPTRSVLSGAILVFSLMTVILLIVDAGTGGKIKGSAAKTPHYGTWDPNLIFFIWTVSGIAYGMVELIRRVIPADIVGGNVGKLRRMDALVHVLYEVAGTIGAFASSSAISRFGNNYSYFLTPVFFCLAGLTWAFISPLNFKKAEAEIVPGLSEVDQPKRGYFASVGHGAVLFGKSVWLGAWIVFSHRRFVWLATSYSLALYLHRFLESTLAPAFAKRVLGISAWSQIIVGGSNFGELLGALSVFILSDHVTTPVPWIRLDALMLNIVWILPHFSTIAKKNVSWAWRVAGCFIPISFGWAAGDVSLAAYVQGTLSTMDNGQHGVSQLGAVMAFLYSTYIVLNAVLGALLGKVIDNDFTAHKSIYSALQRVGGIQFSVCAAIIIASTFIPRGALSFNPKMLDGAKPADVEEDADTQKNNATYEKNTDHSSEGSLENVPRAQPARA